MRTGTTRYRGVTYKPYQEFLIEDKDKAEMISLGCVVIEDKVVNPNKVEEPAKEEPKAEEPKAEEPKVKGLKSFKNKDKVED